MMYPYNMDDYMLTELEIYAICFVVSIAIMIYMTWKNK